MHQLDLRLQLEVRLVLSFLEVGSLKKGAAMAALDPGTPCAFLFLAPLVIRFA